MKRRKTVGNCYGKFSFWELTCKTCLATSWCKNKMMDRELKKMFYAEQKDLPTMP